MLRRRPDNTTEFRVVEAVFETAGPLTLSVAARERMRHRIFSRLGEQEGSASFLGLPSRERWVAVPAGIGIAATIIASVKVSGRDAAPATPSDRAVAYALGQVIVDGLPRSSAYPGQRITATSEAWITIGERVRINMEEGAELEVLDSGATAVQLYGGEATFVTAAAATLTVDGPNWTARLAESTVAEIATTERSTVVRVLEGLVAVEPEDGAAFTLTSQAPPAVIPAGPSSSTNEAPGTEVPAPQSLAAPLPADQPAKADAVAAAPPLPAGEGMPAEEPPVPPAAERPAQDQPAAPGSSGPVSSTGQATDSPAQSADAAAEPPHPLRAQQAAGPDVTAPAGIEHPPAPTAVVEVPQTPPARAADASSAAGQPDAPGTEESPPPQTADAHAPETPQERAPAAQEPGNNGAKADSADPRGPGSNASDQSEERKAAREAPSAEGPVASNSDRRDDSDPPPGRAQNGEPKASPALNGGQGKPDDDSKQGDDKPAPEKPGKEIPQSSAAIDSGENKAPSGKEGDSEHPSAGKDAEHKEAPSNGGGQAHGPANEPASDSPGQGAEHRERPEPDGQGTPASGSEEPGASAKKAGDEPKTAGDAAPSQAKDDIPKSQSRGPEAKAPSPSAARANGRTNAS